MNRFLISALVVIVSSGALLRTYKLENRRFDNDEAFAWRVAINPLPELLITAAGDTAPPSHYFLLKGWMKIWGTSPAALRALSVMSGLLLVAATYAVVAETVRWTSTSIAVARFGGLVAALLAAVHSFQLEPNRTARMYGLGALLAVLSAWLLLRALRAADRRYAWWVAYGVIAATFLLTHHFAFFTLAAQGAFALWCVFAPRAKLMVDQAATRRGVLLAGAVGLVLYGPWLPAAVAQTTRVSQSFWIAERSGLEWGQTFVRWCVGVDLADTTWIVTCLGGAALVVARTLRVPYRSHHAPRDDASSRGARGLHYNAAAIALLAQAVLPWVAIALLSTVGDRPMLQDRYLAFSQASWLALLGVVVASVSRPEWGAAIAALLIGAALLGTQQFVAALPEGPPGIVAASERLARDYQPGGVVLVQDAPGVNCLKFYLSQHGAAEIDVRALWRPWPTTGHVNHVASLDSDEFLSRIEDLPADMPQLWFAGTPEKFPGGSNLPGWQWMDEVTYKGHGPQAPDYILRRYERPAEQKTPAEGNTN